MSRRLAASGDMTGSQANLRKAQQYAAKIQGKSGQVDKALGVAKNVFKQRGGLPAAKKPAKGAPPEKGTKPRTPGNPYPNTPAALTSEEQAFFDSQAREANSAFDRIRAEVQNDRFMAAEQAKRNNIDLGWEKGTNARLFGMNAAAQGAGWNPAFMAPGLTGIDREWARDANEVASNLAARNAALDALLQQAREQRRMTLSDIAAQAASKGADLSRLIKGVQ
jgi:flagellar biosynthesis/type III secretory pathway protein FliH